MVNDLPLLFDILQQETRPIYLYGTGDGADKILDVLTQKGIIPAGIFVSEEFFRSQTFRDYAVTTLSALEQQYPPDGFVVLVAFGSHFPEMIRRVKDIASRHPVLIPDVPVAGGTLFDKAFYLDHIDEITRARALFADDFSVSVYDQILEYKLTGRPEPLFDCVSDKEEVFSSLLSLQKPGEKPSYLDLGAYTGDTIQEFLQAVDGEYASITAFEPDERTFRKLQKNTEGLSGVTLYHGAALSETGTLEMTVSRGRGTRAGATGIGNAPLKGAAAAGKTMQIPCYKIDDLSLSPSYVKMDVEGAEKEALTGMKETLLRCRPSLNIALYHRSEDIFELPLLLHEWLPDHRFYLRRHNCFPCWEVNLYAKAAGSSE